MTGPLQVKTLLEIKMRVSAVSIFPLAEKPSVRALVRYPLLFRLLFRVRFTSVAVTYLFVRQMTIELFVGVLLSRKLPSYRRK